MELLDVFWIYVNQFDWFLVLDTPLLDLREFLISVGVADVCMYVLDCIRNSYGILFFFIFANDLYLMGSFGMFDAF